MNDQQSTDYLTKTELASMLRVSTRTITNYVSTGALPEPVKFGRRALWCRTALLAFVQSRQPTP
ncbi:putative DNA-binding transcriptional regulator AlpA [Rhizobacter sp. SG703]|nr:putative DNA-binding transcriptional regulator AlpA [Rhizobacter sp. SG703]